MTDDITKGDTPLNPPSKEVGREEEKENRIYEVGYLLLPTLAAEDVPREVTAIKDLLEKAGAAVISEEFPKFRALAYGMRKQIGGAIQSFTSAYFGWVKFETEAEKAKEIEAELKRNPNLLRFLLIKTVREETRSVPRAPRPDARPKREAPAVGVPVSTPVSEAELDKSIEKLIAE